MKSCFASSVVLRLPSTIGDKGRRPPQKETLSFSLNLYLHSSFFVPGLQKMKNEYKNKTKMILKLFALLSMIQFFLLYNKSPFLEKITLSAMTLYKANISHPIIIIRKSKTLVALYF